MSVIRLEGCRSCGKAGGGAQRILVAHQPPDLRLLKTWRRHYDSVQVRLDGATDEERARIETEIADGYFACGCGPARWAAVAVLAGAVIAFLFARDSVADLSWAAWLNTGLVAVLVPTATMLAAISRARVRLWRTLDQLAARDVSAS